jgi:hypothetical protein
MQTFITKKLKEFKKLNKKEIDYWDKNYKHLENTNNISKGYNLLSEIRFNISEHYEDDLLPFFKQYTISHLQKQVEDMKEDVCLIGNTTDYTKVVPYFLEKIEYYSSSSPHPTPNSEVYAEQFGKASKLLELINKKQTIIKSLQENK